MQVSKLHLWGQKMYYLFFSFLLPEPVTGFANSCTSDLIFAATDFANVLWLCELKTKT